MLTHTFRVTFPSSFFFVSALRRDLSRGHTIPGQLTKADKRPVHINGRGLVNMCMAIATRMCARAIA